MLMKSECAPKFIAALFTVAKIGGQLKCSSKDKQNVVGSRVLFSLKKRNAIICNSTEGPGGYYAQSCILYFVPFV